MKLYFTFLIIFIPLIFVKLPPHSILICVCSLSIFFVSTNKVINLYITSFAEFISHIQSTFPLDCTVPTMRLDRLKFSTIEFTKM